MLNLIVLDLEATSTGHQDHRYRREIIEIGAVKCYISDNIWKAASSFDCFVKPQINPRTYKVYKRFNYY